MATGFRLFGPHHLAILALVVTAALGLSTAGRRFPAQAGIIRSMLGLVLTANEVTWYVFRYRQEGFRFPDGLPLQLCDLALWLTVISAFTLRPRIYEVAYFAGLGGSSMALLTPDLWAPLWSYPTAYFFLSHGLVVVTLWTLTAGRMIRPGPGCVLRAFLILNMYAAAVGVFNAAFQTNYLYLCRKPEGASLLDYLGPWPAYVAAGEGVALAVFWLLWLPVRPRPASGPAAG